jgi:hypothetical protein
VSHLRRGQSFYRLNEIDTHRLAQEVFETCRCKPFGREASYPAYGYPAYGHPGYAQPGCGYPGYSGYPAYCGPPGYGYPGYSGQSGYPAYSGPPGCGYQSRPLYSPFSGSAYPVAGYPGDRASEDWSPGAEYAIEPYS